MRERLQMLDAVVGNGRVEQQQLFEMRQLGQMHQPVVGHRGATAEAENPQAGKELELGHARRR